MERLPVSRNKAARQRKVTAKPAKRKPRGKPFEKGNPYRWKPGESGNPSGNAESLLVRAALIRHAQRDAADALDDVNDLTWLDRIAIAALKRAAENDAAFKEFADRVDGRPTQKNELTGKDGKELNTGPAVLILDK